MENFDLKKMYFMGLVSLLGLVLFSCRGKDDEDHSGDGNKLSTGALALDLYDAKGLALVEDDSSSSLGLLSYFFANDSKENNSLVKINSAGEVTSAIRKINQDDENYGGEPIPRVTAIGFSPTGEVYVLFEHPFVFKTPEDMSEDFHDSSSPYTCQLFMLKYKLSEARTTDINNLTEGNLTCVTTQHEIPTWRNTSIMQFDENGILYFPAHVPGNWKDIYYAYDPKTEALTEKVNGKICWRDVRVLKKGDIFYTGTTSSGDDCSGESYFRYISPDNQLVEVARDWWDFKYLQDNSSGADKSSIIFYGPNPDTSSGLPSWDSACLYKYDPSADSSSKVTTAAKCMNDIWRWVNANDLSDSSSETPSLATRQTANSRCENEGQIFIGGGGIDQIAQNSEGKVYIAGELKKKKAGTYTCNLDISVPHCSSKDPSHSDESTCTSAGYNWVKDGWCEGQNYNNKTDCETNSGTWNYNSQWYNNVDTSACISDTTGWTVRNPHCQEPSSSSTSGDVWTQTINGLAYVNPDSTTSDEKLLDLISESDESVIRFWIINDKIYYASFKDGTYYLKSATEGSGSTWTQKVLLENHEVYNLSADPNHSERLLFDALNFENNQYKFGSLNPFLDTEDEIANSITSMTGLTGQVKTLIIVPSY